MKKNFSKSDLRDGDKLTYRDGTVRFVYGVNLLNSDDQVLSGLIRYNNDLTNERSIKDNDIIKVERTTTETIFELIETIELVSGEIYFNVDRVVRFNRIIKEGSLVYVFSQAVNAGNFYRNTQLSIIDDKLSISTPKQKATLIKAEIENGYLWDDKTKELIKID